MKPSLPFADTLTNLVSMLGTSKDKQTASHFNWRTPITESELNAAYEEGGIVGKIVDCVADDMVKKWRTIFVEDEDAQLFYGLERSLGVAKAVSDAERWARLHSGSVILLDIEGDDSSEPLVLETVSPNKPLTAIRVAVRHELSVVEFDRKFARAERLRVNETGEVYHRTRFLGPFDGIPVTPDRRRESQGWGGSLILRCYDSLLSEATTAAAAASLVHEVSMDVIGVKGLESIVATPESRAAYVQRLKLGTTIKSLLNAFIYNADSEVYEKKGTAAGLQGLAPLMDRFANRLSAETDIPITRLFGKSASGLNTTGEVNQADYRDMLSAKQIDTISPALAKLDPVICRSVYGRVPPGFWSEWIPLDEPTAEQKATTQKIKAEAAEIYRQGGVVLPSMIAQELADNGPYTIEPDYVEELRKIEGLASEPEAEPVEPMAAASEPEPEVATTPGAAAPDESDVQKQALNGAQIASLVQIAAQVKLEEIPVEAAIAIIMVAIPGISEPQARRIVGG